MKKTNNSVTGKTKVAGIFGYPVSHSFSPAMHNAAYKELAFDAVYVPFSLKPEEVSTAVRSIKTLGLIGVNVTVPLKEKVIPFLDSIDALARRIGSVNTIINRNGKLVGYNTDAEGFLKDLSENRFNPRNKTASIIGAGGAGKAIAAALVNAGAKKVYVSDLNPGLAIKTARRFSKTSVIHHNKLGTIMSETDILINATPCGMKIGDKSPIDISLLHSDLFVYDLVYHRETELLRAAIKKGARTANGLGMLLFQGVRAFELMTGKKAPVEIMKNELRHMLKNIRN